MFSSHILSRLLRFWLLGVFIVGLFISIGEVSINNNVGISLSQGGIYTVAAETPAANATDATAKEPESKTIEAFIDIANLFIGVLTFLITPLIMLAGWLLSPDWTFGEIFWLRPILHQIWIFISNIVYVIFGFFLVFIAFANIFGWEHAKAYEMKTMLPKLVIGILIVPFTWFIVSAVLSISNILTASVIQLPIDTINKAGSSNTLLNEKIIPREITYDKNRDSSKDPEWGTTVDDSWKANGGGTNKANGNFYATECSDAGGDTTQANREWGLCLSIRDVLTNGKGGAYNLLSVYAYGIFNIQNYKFITTKEKIGTLGNIASKLSFSFLFFVVFGILIIAIVYALFSRALILWLYAMFSPIFALNYVMDFKNESVKSSVGKMSIEKFLSLALVPVYVSAALAFGLMFLGLVMNAKGTITSTAGEGSLTWESGVEINTTKDGVSTFKFWEVTLTTKWVLTGDQKSGLNGALDLGTGIIGTIIMNVLALVILWMAVMAALNADDVTKAAVAPIKSFGDEVGKLALKSPQYIPIPLPDGKSISMAGVGQMGSGIRSKIEWMATSSGAELWQQFGEKIGNAIGLQSSAITQALDKFRVSVQKIGGYEWKSPQQIWEALRTAIAGTGLTAEQAISSPLMRKEILGELQKAYNIKADEPLLKQMEITENLTTFDNLFKDLTRKTHGRNWLDYLADKSGGWGTDKDTFSNIFTGKIENNYNVGGVRMNNDGKIATVDLNFDNDKIDMPVNIDQSGNMDKEKIATAIKDKYQKQYKKPLDNNKANDLADEVIRAINEAKKPK